MRCSFSRWWIFSKSQYQCKSAALQMSDVWSSKTPRIGIPTSGSQSWKIAALIAGACKRWRLISRRLQELKRRRGDFLGWNVGENLVADWLQGLFLHGTQEVWERWLKKGFYFRRLENSWVEVFWAATLLDLIGMVSGDPLPNGEKWRAVEIYYKAVIIPGGHLNPGSTTSWHSAIILFDWHGWSSLNYVASLTPLTDE